MASGVYNSAKVGMVTGAIDLDTDTLKVMLVTGSYTPNADHEFVSDANANELNGTGYTGGFNGSGRKTLANKAVNKDNTNDRAEFTFDAVVWSAINAGTARYALIIKEITNDAASKLIAWLDLGASGVVTNGGDVTVTPNAEGAIQLT